MLVVKKTCISFVIFGFMLLVGCSGDRETTITIGTGDLGGATYLMGSELCQIISNNREGKKINCSVETSGSVNSALGKVQSNSVDMAIVRSDQLYYAYHGKEAQSLANKDFRALFSLAPEVFTVLTRKDSKISYFEDLKGKRIGIGHKGSDHRIILEQLMAEYKWQMDDFKSVSELELDEMINSLCNNKLDAVVVLASHPDSFMQQVIKTCDVELVSAHGDEVDSLLRKHPYYQLASVYQNVKDRPKINTFGFDVIMTASKNTSDIVVESVVHSVFSQLKVRSFEGELLSRLNAKTMVSGLIVPLHEAAKKYYLKEKLM